MTSPAKATEQTFTITVAGAAWIDALDPLATGMQAELGLPEPVERKVGRGFQMIYRDVTREVARELADYLEDRAEVMLGQDNDPADNGPYYAARESAARIRRVTR